MENISDLNLLMICGTEDLLASPKDYIWLHDQLKDRNNITFKEYDLGHTGLMMPKDE